ncbi:MAG: hypothetical protein WC565_01380 [Parcubacteria group bacterium]
MKFSIKKPVIISLLAVFPVLAFPCVSHASELSSATENLSSSTTELIEAKDSAAANVLSPEEELASRKKVVADALSLSLKEVEAARTKLNSANIEEESDLATIRSSILEWLDLEEKYFKEAEDELTSDDLNLEEVKSLAKDVKAHRDESYNDNLTDALNFIFVLETSKLTDTANERWVRINDDLQKIEKAGLIKKDLFVSEMAEARKMIDGARALVERSFTIIREIYLPAPKEEAEMSAPIEDESVIAEEKIPSVKDLCSAAIVNLKSGYAEFIKISTAVKKLLKLP